MKKTELKRIEKQILKSLIDDIKNLKKHSFYSIPENKQFYMNLCDMIIKAINTTIKK